MNEMNNLGNASRWETEESNTDHLLLHSNRGQTSIQYAKYMQNIDSSLLYSGAQAAIQMSVGQRFSVLFAKLWSFAFRVR